MTPNTFLAGLIIRNRALAAEVERLTKENATLREVAQWAATGQEAAYELGRRDERYKPNGGRG